MQQVTAPDVPHVERAAQATTARRHEAGSVPAFTAAFAARATQRVWRLWPVPGAQGHCASATERTAATADWSVQAARATSGRNESTITTSTRCRMCGLLILPPLHAGRTARTLPAL